jgi:hypothetical protein
LATGAVLLAFTAGIAALSIASVSSLGDRSSLLFDKGVDSIQSFGALRTDAADIDAQILRAIAMGDSMDLGPLAEAHSADVDQQFQIYLPVHLDDAPADTIAASRADSPRSESRSGRGRPNRSLIV